VPDSSPIFCGSENCSRLRNIYDKKLINNYIFQKMKAVKKIKINKIKDKIEESKIHPMQ